jgi:DNA primase
MDAKQINQTVELLPLVGSELRKAGAYFVGPCPMCGGEDRFTVMHTSGGDRWHCRQCGDGKYHGVIDFIMARDRVSFLDACKALSGAGEVVLTPTRQPARQPATTPKKEPTTPDAPTQARMMAAMDAAGDALYTPDGQQAQDYLRSRGLALGTWYAWHIGYNAKTYDTATETKRPAIWLPWYYIDAQRESITTIKYRFIDELAKDNKHRFNSISGGKITGHLYGLWDAQPTDKVLLLVEGELNALSLWQQRPRDVTVLSIGSEGGGPEVIAQIAQRQRVLFGVMMQRGP